MSIYKLDQDMRRSLLEEPEAAMALHVVEIIERHHKDKGRKALIFSGTLMLMLDNSSEELFALVSDVLNENWIRPGDLLDERERVMQFEQWAKRFDNAPSCCVVQGPYNRQALGFIVHKGGYLSPPPPRPRSIYGHLPFTGRTEPDDILYRFEFNPLVVSRVDQANGAVRAGTYLSPASELPFLPTGFAVVARCALPGLLPASFRWEIRPNTGTPILCGASVPLYGQAGGGVEVCLPSGCSTRAPIANPTVLPAL